MFKKKVILKGLIFIIIILMINALLTPIFVIKSDKSLKLNQGLYMHTGNSYDVVLIGPSHMESGINPDELWGRYGITSFNYATGGQPIDVTYYLLKEILKNHGKPVVVLDVYYLGLTNKYGEEGYIRNVIDNMKFSFNKLDAIIHCTPRPQWLSYIFPIIKYHSRWKNINEGDYKVENLSENYYKKGFSAEYDPYGIDNNPKDNTEDTSEMPSKTKLYLNKIIALTKKEGLKLVLVNVPYDYSVTDNSTNWHNEPEKLVNKVEEIAKVNNIPFLNYCDKFDELNFDFKNDMYNAGHMNMSGSTKVTLNLGKYLSENCDLKDHRNDKAYADWNTDYTYYLQTGAAYDLKSQKNISDYISMLDNPNYITTISCNNYGFSQNAKQVKSALSKLSLNIDKCQNKDNYLAIINNNKIVYEKYGSAKYSVNLAMDNVKIDITTSSKDKNMPGAVINSREYLNKYNGLNIIVYDKVLKKVVDSINLDDKAAIRR